MTKFVECKDYFEDGTIARHVFYEGCSIYGEYKEYHENGNLSIRAFYKNNKLHGECKKYDINGVLTEHLFYKDDELVDKVCNEHAIHIDVNDLVEITIQ